MIISILRTELRNSCLGDEKKVRITNVALSLWAAGGGGGVCVGGGGGGGGFAWVVEAQSIKFLTAILELLHLVFPNFVTFWFILWAYKV